MKRITFLTTLLKTISRGRLFAVLLAFSTLFVGCGPTRPVIPPGEIPTARYLTPEDEQYGQEVLSSLSQRYPVERDSAKNNKARDVVMRLAKAAKADREPWHVYVLKGDDVVNAAATRGNHVFVWSGMLQRIENEAQLAAVLAHELGHVLAGHTEPTAAEEAGHIFARVSGQITAEALRINYGPLGDIAGALVTETLQALAVNPESQRQEFEADHIGFFLMADAGYDPQQALKFWQTMGEVVKGSTSESMQFFSTHPATSERLAKLQEMLPEASLRYEDAKAGRPVRKQPTPAEPDRVRSPAAALPDDGDTFVIGRDEPAQPSQKARRTPSAKHEHRPEQRVVTQPSAAIRANASDSSERITYVKKDDVITVGERVGDWYRVLSPSEGFIDGFNLTPTDEATPR